MDVEITKLHPPILAGFGNPLLDICVTLKDKSFFTEYNLESDGATELNSSELLSIINYFKKEQCEFKYCAGGCVQNSLRVFQWIIKQPYYSVYFGGIGEDEEGKLLEEEVNKAGVVTRYSKNKLHSTGTCVAITNGVERSLVAHLGAANIFLDSDFNKQENVDLFKKLFIVYIEAFFITHSFQTTLEIIRLCKINGVAIVFNLSGAYIFKNHYNEVLHLVESSDVVIGNVMEYKTFWEHYKKESSSIKEILTTIKLCVNKSKEENVIKGPLKLSVFEKTKKIVACTQGCDSVLCVYGNNEFLEVMPEVIDQSMIKDTTGAGDAFAGGFLAGILQNKGVKESIELGCWAAGQIIRQVGCNLPS